MSIRALQLFPSVSADVGSAPSKALIRIRGRSERLLGFAEAYRWPPAYWGLVAIDAGAQRRQRPLEETERSSLAAGYATLNYYGRQQALSNRYRSANEYLQSST